MGLSGWFEYETGHAWCESAYKYTTNPYIAEFANTVTNLPIIVLPLINALMLKKYTSEVNGSILIPNLLMTVNGIASSYYHATINLFGQLVDELSILWIINTFLVVYAPVAKWYPERHRDKITLFRVVVVTVALLISCLCFIEPNLNALALMVYSIPAVFLIRYEAKHSGIPDIAGFPRRVFILWGMAVAFWFADRLMCDVWLYLGTPYLHALFHLLSSVAAYSVFVMFSMIDIEARSDQHKFTVAVRYFPDKKGALWSLPYLSIVEKHTTD
ncbi:hypothetical protein PENTCL1PPCAC_11051 [Pristionchus entomophagus]|uniref:Alkaline ceramidase n=1 Tax=Pristionchus entomophagus TaxID=358040 RepID=A0AAV5T067_9BILA|nr:hypothetical protein PENTCL1PPCAC_11051 [Pristionchus entomophagus]